MNLLNGPSPVTSCSSSSTFGSGLSPNRKYWNKNRKWLRNKFTFHFTNVFTLYNYFKHRWIKSCAFKKNYNNNQPEIILWNWRMSKFWIFWMAFLGSHHVLLPNTSGFSWNPNRKYWKKNRKWLRKKSTFILRNFSHFKFSWNLGGKSHAFKKNYNNQPEIISWIWRTSQSEPSEWPFTSHILFFFQYFWFRFGFKPEVLE